MNFAKFLRTPFLQNTSGRLLLKTVKGHQHETVNYVKFPENQCSEDYIWETARGLSERVLGHTGRDAKSQLVKHAIENIHKYPEIEDFDIFCKRHRNKTFKRKVTESLSIKDIRPTLNTYHEKSMQLRLFN